MDNFLIIKRIIWSLYSKKRKLYYIILYKIKCKNEKNIFYEYKLIIEKSFLKIVEIKYFIIS